MARLLYHVAALDRTLRPDSVDSRNAHRSLHVCDRCSVATVRELRRRLVVRLARDIVDFASPWARACGKRTLFGNAITTSEPGDDSTCDLVRHFLPASLSTMLPFIRVSSIPCGRRTAQGSTQALKPN